jgi:hypothetical protein
MYDTSVQVEDEHVLSNVDEIDNCLSLISYNNEYNGESVDTNFYKLKRIRQVGLDDDNKPILNRVTIKAYGSGQRGTYIVNAVTGYTSNCKVGTKDEYLFYRVSISTGEGRNRQPIYLYYDSPEQYEEHYMTKADPYIKDAWNRRYRTYLNQLKE